MKLQAFHIQQADWSHPAERQALMHLRLEVFVEECGVPGVLECDDLDPGALHLLARDHDDAAIGTARLTRAHRLERLAVAIRWRGQGVGTALLREACALARARGWPELALHAPLQQVGLFRRAGFQTEGELFEEDGLIHQRMICGLGAPGTSADPAAAANCAGVAGRDALAQSRLQLLSAARHQVDLYLLTLDPDVYSAVDELAQLRRLATSGRSAQIRVLLHDTSRALGDGHRLISLAQRLPTAIQIRRPVEEVDLASRAAYLLNDVGGYLLLPDAQRPQGRAALNDAPGQAPLRRHFVECWERAEQAGELVALSL